MSANYEQEVLAVEEQRCNAISECDGDTLANILHEDYTHVTGAGTFMNRDQYLEWAVTEPRKHVRHDLKVRVIGETAVMCGWLTNHFTNAEPYETYVTQVYHKENGEWRLHAFQFTPKIDSL